VVGGRSCLLARPPTRLIPAACADSSARAAVLPLFQVATFVSFDFTILLAFVGLGI